jgi:hypothetical protein
LQNIATLAIVPGAARPKPFLFRGGGSITPTTVVGGVEPFTVTWTGLDSQALTSQTNLRKGTYTVTVQDAENNSVSYTYKIKGHSRLYQSRVGSRNRKPRD